MNKSIRRWSLALATAVSVILPSPFAAASSTEAWREAFQSSPAAYDAMSPEALNGFLHAFKLPPQFAEQMRPKQVMGTLRKQEMPVVPA